MAAIWTTGLKITDIAGQRKLRLFSDRLIALALGQLVEPPHQQQAFAQLQG